MNSPERVSRALETGKFFIDARGKDISFDRWRISLYYHRSFAETLFFQTEDDYRAFIAKHNNGYTTYKKFAAENDYDIEQ